MDSGQHAEKRPNSFLRIVASTIVAIAIILGLSFVLRTFVVQPYLIPSGSMEDTIIPGDMVFSEKVTYYTRSVQPGEIVTFVSAVDDDGKGTSDPTTLIKRVIAVGGQTVDIIDGCVYVDGVQLIEEYTSGPTTALPVHAHGVDVTYPYTVPEGYLWVMGDNRAMSKDSRYFGAVPESSVTGRAALIYWPITDIKLLS